MPTECSSSAPFVVLPVEGQVGAGFDSGAITSDAIALLLGQTDRAIRLTERFGACFSDTHAAELVEYQVEALVMQLIVGSVLGYEDLNDHDVLIGNARVPCAIHARERGPGGVLGRRNS